MNSWLDEWLEQIDSLSELQVKDRNQDTWLAREEMFMRQLVANLSPAYAYGPKTKLQLQNACL